MARQNIELGTPPSGVGGDTPRSANLKVNANFSELYPLVGLGGVVDSGSNSGGSWVKYASGTMIARHKIYMGTVPAKSASAKSWQFPIQFTAPPIVLVTPGSTNGYGYLLRVGLESDPTVSTCGFSMVNDHDAARDLNAFVTAMGDWK